MLLDPSAKLWFSIKERPQALQKQDIKGESFNLREEGVSRDSEGGRRAECSTSGFSLIYNLLSNDKDGSFPF